MVCLPVPARLRSSRPAPLIEKIPVVPMLLTLVRYAAFASERRGPANAIGASMLGGSTDLALSRNRPRPRPTSLKLAGKAL